MTADFGNKPGNKESIFIIIAIVPNAEGKIIAQIVMAEEAQPAILTGHTKAVIAIAFSPDGKTLATASEDGTAKLWNLQTHQERVTLRGHKDLVLSIAFSPDGRWLATGSHDKTVHLWNATTGEPQAVPALLKALRDEEKSVRHKAATALRAIGTPEALKALAEYEKKQ